LGLLPTLTADFFKSRSLGIHQFFDSVTISSLAGAAKPATKIFSYALEQHMMNPDEVLHVGDHPIEDFEGAKQAGLHAVLIDRSGSVKGDHHSISSLTSVPTLPLLQSVNQ